jgi:hypothetical protein
MQPPYFIVTTFYLTSLKNYPLVSASGQTVKARFSPETRPAWHCGSIVKGSGAVKHRGTAFCPAGQSATIQGAAQYGVVK